MHFLSRPWFLFWLSLLLCSTQLLAAPVFVGKDIAYHLYQDKQHQLDLDGFLTLLDEGLPTYTQPLSEGYVRPTFWLHWVFPEKYFAQQPQLLQITPNFLDEVTLYYRPVGDPSAAWEKREAGDLTLGIRGDLDYRFPVFKIPQTPPPHLGYEFVARIKTTSTVIFEASLWQPEEFVVHSTRQTAYLSFYFGLTALSTFLAFVLAVVMRTRLLWAVVGFSSIYILIASIQGYITWVFPTLNFPLQHYLSSITTLVSYAFLIWVSAESLDLKKYLPKIYKIMLAAMLIILAQLSFIPFGLYGAGFEVQGAIYLCVAALFFFSFFYVWHKENYRLATLLFGLSPLVCFAASFLSLAIVMGWISYDRRIYLVWQYAPIVNTLLVMVLAMVRRYEEKRLRQQHLHMTRELQIEREAGFHQRQFMGMVSHEFRTPLSIISMALQNLYLIEEPNQQVVQRYKRIQRATERLVQLTDNCLADARISAKALSLEMVKMDWGQLLEEATALASFSEQHKLIITFDGQISYFSALANHSLNGDKALLQIALSNLVDNAVKHTPKGQIHLNLSIKNERYLLTITDQGKGVAPEMVNQLFERYQHKALQASQISSTVKSYGLGLFVAHEIVKAHAGSLKLVKNSSQGCTFQLELLL